MIVEPNSSLCWMALAALSGMAFIWQIRRTGHPLLPPTMFKNGSAIKVIPWLTKAIIDVKAARVKRSFLNMVGGSSCWVRRSWRRTAYRTPLINSAAFAGWLSLR
jgi:hypothetical protein